MQIPIRFRDVPTLIEPAAADAACVRMPALPKTRSTLARVGGNSQPRRSSR